MRRLIALCVVALLLACGEELPPWVALRDLGADPLDDADPPGLDRDLPGGDGDVTDGMATDGGRRDGGLPDRGPVDRGLPDRDLADAERADGRITDAAPPDGAPADLGLPDLDLPDLGLPDLGLPDLGPPDLDPPDLDPPDLDLGLVAPEVCNGVDDDENGVVDDAPVCGGVIARQCRVFLGTLDGWRADLEATNTWGACPGADTDGVDLGDRRGCVGTRRDSAFRRAALPPFEDLNSDNHFAIAFLCDDHPVAAWTQTHCRAYLGQADNNAARGADNPWERCPAAEGPIGNTTCVSSGGDGRFHPMRLLGGVDQNDDFAVAFICHDPADPTRGEAMQASAAIAFAWANGNGVGGGDGSGDWVVGCPGRDGDGVIGRDGIGCASSAFDGRFHHFPISEGVGDDDGFGIALIPHPDAP